MTGGTWCATQKKLMLWHACMAASTLAWAGALLLVFRTAAALRVTADAHQKSGLLAALTSNCAPHRRVLMVTAGFKCPPATCTPRPQWVHLELPQQCRWWQ
jgi:hypothetical protein